MSNNMFCFQCEQSAAGGCKKRGVCGKDATVAALQDVLIHLTLGIGMYANRAAKLGVQDREVDVFMIKALFTTVTNVDFDAERMKGWIESAVQIRDKARKMYEGAAGTSAESLSGPATWNPGEDIDSMVIRGREIGIDKRREALGEDIVSLQEISLYGLKGGAAYLDHAQILGKHDDQVYAGFNEALDLLAKQDSTVDELLGLALRVGELNLKAMELLDSANTGKYGHPKPTAVRITPKKGKAIVVSGHDLKDLEELLKQTEGKGINIYTHGEMLPAHGYPELKKYPHFVGNFGGAWQNQIREFDKFPGAILMTTNCIQKPKETYNDRIFTSGLVAWPGVRHISDHDFSPVIEAALAAPGFAEDDEDKTIMVGFGHDSVIGVADQVIEGVKSGAIRHFFLIGGCDGAKMGRNYYTDLAKMVPEDCLILTLACGKFRFNKLEFGSINGIPRLLDIGQCNDAYSAIKIAVALSEAFEVDINNLPLSMVLSWYEQKAVAVLLTLLYLGVKNIRLGPTMPQFVSPSVLNVLVEKFNIIPITTAEQDLKTMLEPESLDETVTV